MTTICIDVGHDVEDRGACSSCLGYTEWEYNNELASILAGLLMGYGFNPIIVYRKSYTELPEQINNTKADLTISLHCNAFNGSVSGTETLYYGASSKSKALAKSVQTETVIALGLPDRGAKGLKKGDRGYSLLLATEMPHILVEPFFIDNDDDLSVGLEYKRGLARAYAKGIFNHFTD